MNLDLLADLQSSGFTIFLEVPNTKAVTQETNQNYSPFKMQYCNNLDTVVNERSKKNKSTYIPLWQVRLFVYGGVDTETTLVVKSAFEAGFSREACRNAWGKVGAVPLTRACLENNKVCKLLGDGTNAYQALLQNIQAWNDTSTHTLTLAGYKGKVLQAAIKEYQKTEAIMEEHSKDCLALLVKANTCGKLFSMNIASHLTAHDSIFLATKKTVQEKEKK
jgi:hypothetical protein